MKEEDRVRTTFYVTLPSDFGTFSIVWREVEGLPRINRLFLSNELGSSNDFVQSHFTHSSRLSHPAIAELGKAIQASLGGRETQFDLDLVALEECSEFQRRVLLAEYGIPRGWVSTYGRIGEHLGVVNGGRAVGRALARNPFPIVIPCHRAVRANGALGGYQGGLEMKRALLELEGVTVSEEGRVLTDNVYY